MGTEVQTSYLDHAKVAYPGMIFDGVPSAKRSYENAEASVAIPPGVGVTRYSELKGKLPAAAADFFAGVAIHQHTRNNVSAQDGYEVGAEVAVLEEGEIYVKAEETVAVGDDVYMRVAVNTTEQLGAFRKSSDSGKCVKLRGARWTAGGDATNPPALRFSAQQQAANDLVEISYVFGQITATTTFKVQKTRADRHFVVDEVELEVPATGVTSDVSNKYAIALNLGAQAAAAYDTGVAAITADTITAMTNDTLAHRTAAPGTEIDLVATLTGTKTLPTGRLTIKGHYV